MLWVKKGDEPAKPQLNKLRPTTNHGILTSAQPIRSNKKLLQKLTKSRDKGCNGDD
jgi:hypothetical protein